MAINEKELSVRFNELKILMQDFEKFKREHKHQFPGAAQNSNWNMVNFLDPAKKRAPLFISFQYKNHRLLAKKIFDEELVSGFNRTLILNPAEGKLSYSISGPKISNLFNDAFEFYLDTDLWGIKNIGKAGRKSSPGPQINDLISAYLLKHEQMPLNTFVQKIIPQAIVEKNPKKQNFIKVHDEMEQISESLQRWFSSKDPKELETIAKNSNFIPSQTLQTPRPLYKAVAIDPVLFQNLKTGKIKKIKFDSAPKYVEWSGDLKAASLVFEDLQYDENNIPIMLEKNIPKSNILLNINKFLDYLWEDFEELAFLSFETPGLEPLVAKLKQRLSKKLKKGQEFSKNEPSSPKVESGYFIIVKNSDATLQFTVKNIHSYFDKHKQSWRDFKIGLVRVK
jgi:hypothetical protein